MAKDLVIPIVFPDYKITVEIQRTKVDIIPWVDFDNFTTPKLKDKISNLGHAGVLFINGKTGITKYYEYGRYDPPANLGIVVKARNLPDAKIINGELDIKSLKSPLDYISRISGQAGRIHGVYIELKNKYQTMLEYAQNRKAQNANLKRTPYNLTSNSCIHFVKKVTEAAGVETPWMVDPRPNSYIGEFRDEYPDLDYFKDKLVIEGLGTF
ncbi:hypothetical protein [Sessilibacter corallicola]|uniref:Type VI secretion system effector TseH-like domain-containing protein n=1 Tax=Sessilibacter corallicola TaxID=2904075 RepID=A0ABQ0A666_9GAMM